MKQEFKLPDCELLTLKEVLQRLGISKSTWYAGIANSIYPKPIKIGARSRVWAVDDIEKYLAKLNAPRRRKSAN